ncbi:hypothetical protein [Salmonella phage GSW6]|uniref:Uncharacterized protein n=1 Tax=Salmonella phage GSW6 TaxID=3025422 RepID=A0AAE9YK01_9CAUD|nr:hypothetical protein [Salmonella phage GSW6]
MKTTLPKIQAKLNLVSMARNNYLDNFNGTNDKAYKDAWLKEAHELEQLVTQYNKELQVDLND